MRIEWSGEAAVERKKKKKTINLFIYILRP